MKDAQDLNFPAITGKQLPPSERTLDEIDRWIEEIYADFFDREAYDREKARLSVNRPFRL